MKKITAALPEDQARLLEELARRMGLSAEDFVTRTVMDYLDRAASDAPLIAFAR